MTILGERPLTPERARAQLAELRGRGLNFDPARVGRDHVAGVCDMIAETWLVRFQQV